MDDLVQELNKNIVSVLNLSSGMDAGTGELKQLIQNLIYQYLPDMVLVRLDEFQDSDKQTYKSRCEKLIEQNTNLEREIDDVRSQREMVEAQYENYKDIKEKFFSNTEQILDQLRVQMEREIIVSNVKCYDYKNEQIITESDSRKTYEEDDFSVAPAVYESHRPSWFTPLHTEFNQKNSAIKTANQTKGAFLEQLAFWKKASKSDKPDAEKAKDIDFERRKNIAKLLNSTLSNEEKFIKYMLLTPGISKDFLKTLTGAEELGLDANVVISYLEQSGTDFNREIFETYVSQVHKGTDYNLKQEFANELVRGDWYIVSNISGSEKKYQLVPIDELKELREKIDSIASILTDMNEAPPKNHVVETEKEVVANDNSFVQPDVQGSDIPDDFPVSEEEYNEDYDYDEEALEEVMNG